MYEKEFHHTPINNKNFLVTGGAGFIGSNIVEYLIRHDAGKVRVLDNLATGYQKNIAPFLGKGNFDFIEGDIRDYDTCQRACEGMGLVCHQAALGSVPRSVEDPLTTNAVNVEGTLNIFYAAKEQQAERVVFASSSSVYGDEPTLPKIEGRIGKPLSPYAVSKKANEDYMAAFGSVYGMKVLGLRYFNVFGPRQDPHGAYAAVIPLFVDGILNKKDVFIDGDGGQTRDFTFVENAVQANMKALTTQNEKAFGEAYNVAVGENFSVNELYNTIAGILGSSQQPIHREPRAGDIRNSLADISKTQHLLDYVPDVRFEDGLKKTVEFFQQEFEV